MPVKSKDSLRPDRPVQAENREQAFEETFDVAPVISGKPRTAGSRKFGAFTYGGVWQGMQPIYRLEQDLGRSLDIVQWFMPLEHPWDEALVRSVTAAGYTPLITWESALPLQDIADGKLDMHLKSWAVGLSHVASDIYLRPFPEMNGDWTAWHGKPEVYVAAWRHIVSVFRLQTSNVKWLWSPNITDEPRTDDNRMERYYPGADFVDILGLDGYNWGSSRNHSVWRSFADVFEEPIERISRLGEQPIWIAETASTELGGDKAAWIQDMFRTRFPRLEAIIWFNENKETDWRINSSPAALTAFQDGLANLDVLS